VGEEDANIPLLSLAEYDFNDNLCYYAVSYTWGSPADEKDGGGMTAERTHKIICNNQSLLVSQNLFEFLCRLLLTFLTPGGELLWIDAVCINQENIDERTS
jgi:hypothetical protein